MAKARAHVIVSGRVQGVFYRAFTEEAARSSGLYGWVRNMPDGRVEAVFEGERQDIETVVLALKKGPPAARVTDAEVDYQEFRNEFNTFSVKYF